MIQPRSYQTKAIQEVFEALKANDDPVLLYSSVGSGKSLISAFICKRLDDANKRVLCLVNSAELVRNNSEAFKSIGGEPSVFCASLSEKSYDKNIVYATPQSVIVAIKNNYPLAGIIFNMIIVDECDNIAFKKVDSIFMRIIRHYKQEYHPMRLLGMSGTPFRLDSGKTESICGEHGFFKTTVGNITTEWLIDNGYLVKPSFNFPSVQSIDMSSYHAEKSVKKKQEVLNTIIDKNKRLTWDILQELQEIMNDRNGAFVFCSSISHCYEAMAALPEGQAKMIIGSTSDTERNEILMSARNKEIKYLVSVSCLLVGIDVPYFCTTVFLRPTNSLRIFLQAIGRSLRLHPDKKNALILDYAQNLDTFQDLDHPIINEALQARDNHEEEEKPFKCWTCGEMAGLHARRCHGMVDGKRCEYFFQFKECPNCFLPNDITARCCRGCQTELIDPNAKLNRYTRSTKELTVLEAVYEASMLGHTYAPIIKIKYVCSGGITVYENYLTNTERARQITYNKFIKLHCEKPSAHYRHMMNIYAMQAMVNEPTLKTPYKLICSVTEYNRLTVSKKMFHERVTQETGWKPAS